MLEELRNNLLISVIVPVYNIADYVEKCIKSIIDQTYRNLEIILIDDGSTDESGEICNRYAETDARIAVFHKMNGGLSDARNYGIERAHGELLGFVDGDDWIHPQMYEIMLMKMQQETADIVSCWFEQEDEEEFNKKVDLEALNIKNMSGAEALIEIETPLVVAWNKLYRKEIFSELRYPVGKLHEDEFVIHKIFRQCEKITIIECSLYFYTIRSNSIVAIMSEQRINDALEALADRVSFADKEHWDEVMPAVVKRYCDYCIDRYYDIQGKRYEISVEIKEKLWRLEHDMCEKYRKIQIDEKYRRFSISPTEYEGYINRKTLKEKLYSTVRRFMKL